jgi:hypothetical protein
MKSQRGGDSGPSPAIRRLAAMLAAAPGDEDGNFSITGIPVGTSISGRSWCSTGSPGWRASCSRIRTRTASGTRMRSASPEQAINSCLYHSSTGRKMTLVYSVKIKRGMAMQRSILRSRICRFPTRSQFIRGQQQRYARYLYRACRGA